MTMEQVDAGRVFLLDDSDREAERSTVRRCQSELGANPERWAAREALHGNYSI